MISFFPLERFKKVADDSYEGQTKPILYTVAGVKKKPNNNFRPHSEAFPA